MLLSSRASLPLHSTKAQNQRQDQPKFHIQARCRPTLRRCILPGSQEHSQLRTSQHPNSSEFCCCCSVPLPLLQTHPYTHQRVQQNHVHKWKHQHILYHCSLQGSTLPAPFPPPNLLALEGLTSAVCPAAARPDSSAATHTATLEESKPGSSQHSGASTSSSKQDLSQLAVRTNHSSDAPDQQHQQHQQHTQLQPQQQQQDHPQQHLERLPRCSTVSLQTELATPALVVFSGGTAFNSVAGACVGVFVWVGGWGPLCLGVVVVDTPSKTSVIAADLRISHSHCNTIHHPLACTHTNIHTPWPPTLLHSSSVLSCPVIIHPSITAPPTSINLSISQATCVS